MWGCLHQKSEGHLLFAWKLKARLFPEIMSKSTTMGEDVTFNDQNDAQC